MAKEEVATRHSRGSESRRVTVTRRVVSRRRTGVWVLDVAGTIACTAPAYAYVDNVCCSFASFALYRGQASLEPCLRLSARNQRMLRGQHHGGLQDVEGGLRLRYDRL